MSNIQQLESGLIKAHQAGDDYAAKMFANEITKLNGVRKESVKTSPKISNGHIFDSVAQGLTLGFSDEIIGGLNATIGTFDPSLNSTTWRERYEGNRDSARDSATSFADRNPKTALAGELAGGLLTGGLGASRVIASNTGNKAVNTIKNLSSAGLLGGAYGAGASEADNTVELLKDMEQGAKLGVVTGGVMTGGGLLARKALQKTIGANPSTAQQKAVSILSESNIPLTTGQKANAPRLQSIETDLSRSILGGDLEKTFTLQREQFQKSLMNKAGFDGIDIHKGLINQDAISAAKSSFRDRYSQVLDNTKVKLGNDDFVNDLADVEISHQGLLPAFQKKQVSEIVDNLLDKALRPEGITGRDYQKTRSLLGKKERQNNEYSLLYGDLKRSLDKAFMNSVDNVSAKSKRKIDKEYARFKQLETVFKRTGGREVEEGLLPITSLNRESKKAGLNDNWRGLISSASQVIPDKVPNSGTASRALNQILPLGLLSGGLNALSLGAPYTAQKLLSKGVGGDLGREANAATFDNLNKTGLLSVPAISALNIFDLEHN